MSIFTLRERGTPPLRAMATAVVCSATEERPYRLDPTTRRSDGKTQKEEFGS